AVSAPFSFRTRYRRGGFGFALSPPMMTSGFLRDQSVLVTGGAGFIGSHLVDAMLKHGARARVLDNFASGHRRNVQHCLDRIELIEGDIGNFGDCRKACRGAAYVLHHAALGSVPRSMVEPQTTMAVN